MKVVQGDLIKMAYDFEFDVIGHGCNCFCVQKAGIAKQMVKHFGTDYKNGFFTPEDEMYRGDINKLGTIYCQKKQSAFQRWRILPNCSKHVHTIWVWYR